MPLNPLWCTEMDGAEWRNHVGPQNRNVTGRLNDWYEILGLDAGAPESAIGGAIERLSRQASALANTAPDRSQEIRETVRAMRRDLSSGPGARQAYDRELARLKAQPPPGTPASPAQNVAPPEIPSRFANPPFDADRQDQRLPGDDHTVSPSPPSVVDAVVANLVPAVSRFRRFLQSGWSCPTCGSEGRPGDKFCGKCGASMEVTSVGPGNKPTCPNCSAELSANVRFCSRCGTPAP
jgi:hypothetical protein